MVSSYETGHVPSSKEQEGQRGFYSNNYEKSSYKTNSFTKKLRKKLLTGILVASTSIAGILPTNNSLSQEKADGTFNREDVKEMKEHHNKLEKNKGILEKALEAADAFQVPGAGIGDQYIDNKRSYKTFSKQINEMKRAAQRGEKIQIGDIVVKPEKKKGLPKPENFRGYLIKPSFYKSGVGIEYADKNPCRGGNQYENPRTATYKELEVQRENGNWPGVRRLKIAKFNKDGTEINQYTFKFKNQKTAEEYAKGNGGELFPKSASERFIFQGGDENSIVSQIYFLDDLSKKEKNNLSTIFTIYKARTGMELIRHMVSENKGEETTKNKTEKTQNEEEVTSELERKLLGNWETVNGNEEKKGTIKVRPNSITFNNIMKIGDRKVKMIQVPQNYSNPEHKYDIVNNENPPYIDFRYPLGDSHGDWPIRFLGEDKIIMDSSWAKDGNPPKFSNNPLILKRTKDFKEKTNKKIKKYTKEDLYGVWKEPDEDSYLIFSQKGAMLLNSHSCMKVKTQFKRKDKDSLKVNITYNKKKPGEGQSSMNSTISFISPKKYKTTTLSDNLKKVSDNPKIPKRIPYKNLNDKEREKYKTDQLLNKLKEKIN